MTSGLYRQTGNKQAEMTAGLYRQTGNKQTEMTAGLYQQIGNKHTEMTPGCNGFVFRVVINGSMKREEFASGQFNNLQYFLLVLK